MLSRKQRTGRPVARTLPFSQFILLPLGLILLMSAACASPPTPELVYVAPDARRILPTSTPFQPSNEHPLLPTLSLSPALPTAVLPTQSDLPLNLTLDLNPLTGLPPTDPALLDRRPLAIKISNYPRTIRTQQYGLNLADHVFEYYIEWGHTRFIGVFYGNNAPQVGPVRSGRFFDEHVARMYRAFLVFNYADPRELNYFGRTDLAPYVIMPSRCAKGVCAPFFVYNLARLPDEQHLTSYFDMTRFPQFLAKSGLENARQPLRHGFFSETSPSGEQRVRRVEITYSQADYHYWEYDPERRIYLRYQETADFDPEADQGKSYAPLVDAATGEQVQAHNVVVLYVSHTFANTFNAKDEVYHIHLVDWGRAYVFRDGLVVPAEWARPQRNQPLVLTTPSGAPIYLRPGRTFFQVIGLTSTLEQRGDVWSFDFSTP